MFKQVGTQAQEGLKDLKGFDALMGWATFNPKAFRALGLLLSMLLLGCLAYVVPQAFRVLDERSDSLTWNLTSKGQVERRIVMVDVDEKSVEALGAWPWPRSTMAKLVDALNDYGVGLKLFDLVMPDSKEGDQALAKALRSGAPSIGGQIISLDPRIKVKSGVLSNGLPLSASSGPTPALCSSSSQTGFGYIGNEASLLASFSAVGHLTPVLDADGAVRRVPALLCIDGQTYPSLTVASLAWLGNIGQVDPLEHSGQGSERSSTQTRLNAPFVVKGKSLGDAPWSLKFKDVPELSIPLNEEGQIRVSYRVPKNGFVSLSAVDVINHQVPAELLSNVWALVGSTAFGSGDAIPTPHGGAEGGLEVHAQLISAALDEATPFTPLGSVGLEFAALGTALLLLFGLSIASSKPLKSSPAKGWHQSELWGFALPVAGVLLAVALYGLHAGLLLQFNYWMSWSWVAAAIVMATLVLSSQHLWVLRWQRTRVFENLSRFLSDPVAREVALAPASEQVIATQSRVIVMSVNLRNFDRFCASQPPELSAKLLHQYMSLLSAEVSACGGELQHIQGAEALAVWADLDQKGLAGKVAALSQQFWTRSQDWLLAWGHTESENIRLSQVGRTDQDSENNQSSQSSQSGPQGGLVPTTYISDAIRMGRELQLEMGLESGVVLMGTMGPSERRINTVLGEPVQVAHALRSMCADLAYPSLLGPELVAWLQWGLEAHTESTHLLDGEANGFNPIRLGEFLLPGLTQQKLVFAANLDIDTVRLHLVDQSEHAQKVA